MLLTKEVDVCCTNQNKKRLLELNYKWEFKKTIKVKIEHLLENSKAEVEVLCRYCKTTIQKIRYENYLNSKNKRPKSICKIKNFCCEDCKKMIEYKYVKNLFLMNNCKLLSSEIKGAKDKIDFICSCGNKATTSLDVFKKGHKCMKCGSASRGLKRRILFSDIVDLFEKNNCKLLTKEKDYDGVLTIVRFICQCGEEDNLRVRSFEKSPRCTKCRKFLKKETCLKRYGCSNPIQNTSIRKKALDTLSNKDGVYASIQQKYIKHIIGGELNYLFGTSVLDIAFPEEKIYVEYDGGMHDGKVKFGLMSEEEFEKKERNRSYALYRRGWKEVRIISRKDYLPSHEIILQIFEFAKSIIRKKESSWIIFDIDNNLVKFKNNENKYNFGKLSRIRKDSKKFEYLLEVN